MPPDDLDTGSLCACDDVVSSAAIEVSGFLGAGGRLQVDQGVVVTGDLTVSGPLGLNSGGAVTVGGDLRCAGALTSDGPVVVQGDAFIAGEIRVPRLEVGGMLTVLHDAPVTGELEAGGVDQQEANADAFDIGPPCSCPQPVPAPGENADVRPAIPGPEPLTVRLPGPWPAELYIEGAITADLTLAPLDIDPAPAVNARLIVGGGLDAAPPVVDPSMPPASRILVHVAGGEVLSLDTPAPGDQPSPYRYDLIAAEAELVVGGPVTVEGAWQVRRVAAAGAIRVVGPAP